MNLTPESNILLTGASGGLGGAILAELAGRRVNVAAAWRANPIPQEQLDSLSKAGLTIHCLNTDLRSPEDRRKLLDDANQRLGSIDILINNAAIEFTSPFHLLTEGQISDVLAVNLEAPLALTRLALPQMLERGSGHIVNIASLAGKSGPAFQETYAASKAALMAFATSLRESYRGSGVSSSVVCPGFVETGIHARMKAASGLSAPTMLGVSRPETAARAVIRAIESDAPEIIVNPWPVRPLLAAIQLAPRIGAWLMRRTGAHDFFRNAHRALKSSRDKPSGTDADQNPI